MPTPTRSPGEPERLVLRPPPDLPEAEPHGGAAMTALPMLGSLGSMAVMLSFTGASAGPGGRMRTLLVGGVFLLTTLVLVAVQLDRAARARRSRIHLARTSYLLYLDEVRSTIREYAENQRQRALPRTGLRIGTACGPLDLEIVSTPGSPRADPVAAASVARLVAIQSRQPGMPIAVDLEAEPWISIVGDLDRGRSVARAIVCSAAARQPGQLLVAVVAPPNRINEWEWIKWLPDSLALGQCPDYSFEKNAHTTRVLLVADGVPSPPRSLPTHVSVIELQGERKGRYIDCSDATPGRRLDRVSVASAEAIARRIASGRPGSNPSTPTPPDLLAMLDLPLPGTFDPALGWARGEGPGALSVPIGVTEGGSPLTLDLKESAAGGMGPHGLIVGATGSGKSELLRTLVLGMALTHSPERLNLVLVDFKGGATFAGLVGLPQVSALVTNLAQETTWVERMQDALEGEVIRRQEILRSAGEFASTREYAAARAAGHQSDGRPLPPLPALLIIVDEFTELLTARPEFLDVFVALGRVGRSLGIHLVLASQRLEEGRLRGLEAHLSFRIALRTFSESESRAIIGVPDAAHLPRSPGAGLLRSDPATLQRFSTAYVSGQMARRDAAPIGVERVGIEPFVLNQLSGLDRLDQHKGRTPVETGQTLREAAVASLVGRGTPGHKIWLPPLGPAFALGQLFTDLVTDQQFGLSSRAWRDRGPLMVPLGLVDRPRDHRRDVLTADLRGANGHFITVGGTRSGKTTLLQTFVISIAVLNTPLEARFFVIDASGGLAVLKDLPHVAGFADGGDVEFVRRIVDEVGSIIARREGQHPGDAVFLVIDGWDRLSMMHPDLQSSIHDLGHRGLSVNVHLVVSAPRWGEMRIATRELFGTRVELRQGDPLDSEIDRGAASSIPNSQPGRGIVAGPWQVLTALPRLFEEDEDASSSVQRIASAWTGSPAPALAVLPSRILLSSRPESDLCRLGVREQDLETVNWDAKQDQHLLIFGDSGSGKSNLLRTIGREVARTHTPTQAQLVVVDFRGSLFDEFDDEHLLYELRTPEQTREKITELARHLRERMPGKDVTARQLRDRSWWHGPQVFVLVDDYDLVGGATSPLSSLLPLLHQASDVGVHLVLARRASGGSRAMFEPTIQALRDLGTRGVLLSGNPDEGPLMSGVRPTHSPPGRAKLTGRDGSIETCQIVWTEPSR